MPALTVLQKLQQRIVEKFPPSQSDGLQMFAALFFADVPQEDICHRHSSDLYGMVVDYWHFLQNTDNLPKLRVFNPQFEQHGWQSTHTIVSILTIDMPFLIDSIRIALNQLGLTVHLTIHPTLLLKYNEQNQLIGIDRVSEQIKGMTALIHIEIDRHTESETQRNIEQAIHDVLEDVSLVVNDRAAMYDQLETVLEQLEQKPPPLEKQEIVETHAFLRWLQARHFTFLGFREYKLLKEHDSYHLKVVEDSGLGILRNALSAFSSSFAELPDNIRQFASKPHLLILNKASSRATVHRPSYMDYVGIKKINQKGDVVGEYRFLGLYTSSVYHLSTTHIPLLHKKISQVIQLSGYHTESHRGQALLNILESYPRDELFQTDIETLSNISLGILQLQERQRVKLFVRPDEFGRFISCLVFAPRERYDTKIRQQMQDVLLEAFNGLSVEFTVNVSESILAQIHFIVRTHAGSCFDCKLAEVEARLAEITQSWGDSLYDTLLEHLGEERGTQLFHHYQDSFPTVYQEDFTARHALLDIEKMESLNDDNALEMTLYRPLESVNGSLRFKLFHSQGQISLSRLLPILENMGVVVMSERNYEIKQAKASIWIQELILSHDSKQTIDLNELKETFQQTFLKVWQQEVDNDGFNRLVLKAQLNWRDIVVFRAYYKYIQQIGTNFSDKYTQSTLAHHPDIARLLLNVFHARFNPIGRQTDSDCAAREKELQSLLEKIEQNLDKVESLDEDRILRRFLSVIMATLRTNYFQLDANKQAKSYVSFKFDSQQIPGMPEPKPLYEIFVYSPQVEGVHLRGGKVARGGLRWSDRKEDFRTEILGLVKAQMVKNAVIVPVGSKGGFVAKKIGKHLSREEMQKQGIECYKTFIRGLLDVTDNLVDNQIIPPMDVIRHDEDDPYLVVAADKGTATFSDIANGIAKDYGFWLDDAFASGGSAGYDHKIMGITARGAWESVKRHFRHFGVDTQSQDFTAIGIGDMSGDVFGNGMLLSPHIKLVAAFNHLHIFIDPDPNPQTSFAERQRLFELPRSTWADYNSTLMSKGGGVFARSAKSIVLSYEMQQLLGVSNYSMTPNELIKALLCAPVDLLWNGGIGTYVKSENEHHAGVGDKTNDNVRVDGRDLHCKVVGEGGNLGFTQLGRIEYALNGGRIYTDAMDNSAGVDCSDHEVNIKILLNAVVANQDMTMKQRNTLLAEMTDEVAKLVLRDNYLQTQAVSLPLSISGQLLDVQNRFMHFLEQQVNLDRELEFLPNDKAIQARRKNQQGLTSPEISVLLAYSKIYLYQSLLASDLVDESYLQNLLNAYFPQPLPKRYPQQISHHRLQREIIATYLTNMVVNYSGNEFIFILQEETGLSVTEIVSAYVVSWQVFGMADLWADMEALDNQVANDVQMAMMLDTRKLLERATRWLLRNPHVDLNIAATVDYFQSGTNQLAENLWQFMSPHDKETVEQVAQNWIKQDVPETLAKKVASLTVWLSALDVVDVANETQEDLLTVMAVHFSLGTQLKLHWLRDQVSRLPRQNRWESLSRSALRDELYKTHRHLTMQVLQSVKHDNVQQRVALWLTENQAAIERSLQIFTELQTIEKPDLSMLSVALREIGRLG
ncbi:NAD-glutamate dehydrogenase [Candidatus Albibeggiatoa sp. nov. NOAA]|uniref:NAD-glutamate dehydrogenase n=1 Tax=Candidatus Albibeggiatoa sp. nov. NOAA TaxID=3162724 RepID=UPI0032FE85E0|nr:NAD-glutamate dehydrogenase [Thiotrichaceae bacterium]